MAINVEAPMVGKILRVEKNVGDHVEEDEVVVVMEAMKMEIPVVAPSSGVLKELSENIELGAGVVRNKFSLSSSNPPFQRQTICTKSYGHLDLRLDTGADWYGRNHAGLVVFKPAHSVNQKNLPVPTRELGELARG